MNEVLIVLKHEWRYFKTLDRLIRSIFIQSFAPAIILVFYAYFYKTIDLRIAVIVMIMGIPRIPMALMGYSVAGEKVYKTLESIVSTPIQVKSLLIGKMILPIIISFLMLGIASLASLLAANFYSKWILEFSGLCLFSAAEWIIIFGNGMLIVTLISFLTGLLTLITKVPRDGLFITSLTIFMFAIPYSLILYFYTDNALLLSMIALVVLLLVNAICYGIILRKINTPKLFSKSL